MAVVANVRRVEVTQSIVTVSSAIVAGLMVGAAECLFFLYTLNRGEITVLLWRALGFPPPMDVVDVAASTLFAAATVGVGAAFAWQVSGGALKRWGALVSGVILLVTSLSGIFVALAAAGLAAQVFGEDPLPTFRVGFVLASGISALLCTAGVAWLLGARGVWKKAALVGAVTAVSYLAYALIIDPVPGFHVGGGNLGMPRVAFVGNLLAGSLGGTLAFRLLAKQR